VTHRPRVQLWSYNYDPEPTGIGPVSQVWAEAVRREGWDVEVVAAHPHYPLARWGHSLRPYREVRDGIPVLRLPLWIGRDTSVQRLRQEASYAAALGAALPFLGRPDVIVAVSPCLPALAPTLLYGRLRAIPWILWLQDLVTDGATTTGMLDPDGVVVRASRWLEDAAYHAAGALVVISESFRRKVLMRDVAPDRVHRIYNPATRPIATHLSVPASRPYVLSMGNIGHSQGLEAIVRGFERSDELTRRGVRLIITGHGMAADDVRAARTTADVELRGVVETDELDGLLAGATLGLVSQRDDIHEFNLPSKLMNFMAKGVPVLASVGEGSEVAELVRKAGAGWIVPPGDDAALASTISAVLDDRPALQARSAAANAFARREFTPQACAAAFVDLMQHVRVRRGADARGRGVSVSAPERDDTLVG
jgi:colanic acid biosynthesis glycosyl transferase WcaI